MFFRSCRVHAWGLGVFLMSSVGSVQVQAQDYENEVISDNPFAYWRLGEDVDFIAENIGSGLDLLNGTYTGSVLLGEDSLIAGDPDTAVRFEFDGEVRIPDNALINTGGPYQARTTELWFLYEPADGDPGPHMLFEEGGATRGINIYVQEVDQQKQIFMTAWNRAEQRWGPIVVSAPIEEGTIHHAVMVFDASEDLDFGDFDGRITGYLDGDEIGTEPGADQLYSHGDDAAIGGVHVNSLFPDLTNPGDGANFPGIIDEVALYDFPLDDPDDDNDRGDSRVEDHFQIGGNPDPSCPRGLTAKRDATGVKLTWTPGTVVPTGVRVVRNGTELAASAPASPPEFVDTTAAPGLLVYELTFAGVGAGCRTLGRRFDGCISDLTATVNAGQVELRWTNNFAYRQIEVRRGDQLIATIGGDQESYTDADRPPGIWTYSVAPDTGDCDPVTAGNVVEVLGTGTGALLGSDLTDLDDDGFEDSYFPPDNLGGFDAIFFSSDEEGFGGGEFAFNVFDNILGPRNDKWCCGTVFPQIVGADFSNTLDTEFRLTHFTVSSANDVPGRDPRVWRIEGSRDGANWEVIFSQDNPDASLWTERLQVLRFEEGRDYEVQTTAYSMFRMVTDATGATGGNFFQIGEIEFFGEEGGGAPRERICNDGVDNDNDGVTDCNDPDCTANPACQGTRFIRGDADAGGGVNITDVIFLLNHLFVGGPAPSCNEAANADGGALPPNITDVIYVLNFLFTGGPPPPSPFPDCGTIQGQVDCALHTPCAGP